MIKLVKQPGLKKKILSPKQKQLANFKLGFQGEKKAIRHLKSQDYRILATNVWLGKVEIDVIALDPSGDEVVFIEVKARKTSIFGDPSLAVNQQKLSKITQAAQRYLARLNLEKDYRFDIIAILPGKLQHFQNVTW